VSGSETKTFVAPGADSAAIAQFSAFADNFAEEGAEVVDEWPDDGSAPIVLNPSELPDYLSELVVVADDSLTFGGSSYPRAGHTFVLSGQKEPGVGHYLVILTEDFASLPRLGQLVPHYGKYSYLAFQGSRNVGKGQWPAGESPLRVNLDGTR
jgi:hypothetical protein